MLQLSKVGTTLGNSDRSPLEDVSKSLIWVTRPMLQLSKVGTTLGNSDRSPLTTDHYE